MVRSVCEAIWEAAPALIAALASLAGALLRTLFARRGTETIRIVLDPEPARKIKK